MEVVLKLMATAMLAVVIFYMTACQTTPPNSVCVINVKDQKCWISKAQKNGFALKSMNGWFGMSPYDMNRIATKLNDCRENNSGL